jgi:hypothetical protein
MKCYLTAVPSYPPKIYMMLLAVITATWFILAADVKNEFIINILS